LFIKNQSKDFTILTLLTMTYTDDPVAIVTAARDQLPPSELISEEKRLQSLAVIDKARVALEPPLIPVQEPCPLSVHHDTYRLYMLTQDLTHSTWDLLVPE
jgi:hypothetical protein